MTATQVLEKIFALLDWYVANANGNFGESQHKLRFFALFAEAYKSGYVAANSSPRLTGDALWDEATERWPMEDAAARQAKRDALHALVSMWREWQFAWDNVERLDE